MRIHRAELTLAADAVLGEGASWDAGRRWLLWVDILRCEVHAFDPATEQDQLWQVPCHVSFVHPTINGDWVLGTREGIARLNPETGKFVRLVNPEEGIVGNRFNDGKPDPAGRLFAGSISYSGEPGKAFLWRVEPDLRFECVLSGVGNSNGLCWSPDERLFYYIDTKLRRVDAFDYDKASGALSNRRTVISVPPEMGGPDGMTIDEEGLLWVAHWNGGCVARWNPHTGELVEKVLAPCPYVTCPTFGGPGLDVLYFTTAKKGREEAAPSDAPGAGHLFQAKVGVRGLPGYLFAG